MAFRRPLEYKPNKAPFHADDGRPTAVAGTGAPVGARTASNATEVGIFAARDRSEVNAMNDVGIVRLYLLRAMYLLIAVGLAMTVWPYIVRPHSLVAGPGSVVRALLGALAVMSALGLRYPLKMLPMLLFELLWKCIWVAASAIPMWLGPGLNPYASETLFAVLMGVVLVPVVVPWGYVIKHYVRAPSERWRNKPRAQTPQGAV